MRRLIPLLLLSVLSMLSSCSSIDCPVENKVYCKYRLAGPVYELTDTLTVIAIRPNLSDTILLNREEEASDFVLPVSYIYPEDVLVLKLVDSKASVYTDTVRIKKTNIPHFDSVDCAPRYFHHIDQVTFTRHTLDSIIIKNSSLNYDTTGGHLLLYFKSGH